MPYLPQLRFDFNGKSENLQDSVTAAFLIGAATKEQSFQE